MTTQRLLIANPSADVYGSDLQMLESVRGLAERGWDVQVVTTADGPLVPMLREAGATVDIVEFPVLRRAFASPAGLVRLAAQAAPAVWRLRRILKSRRPCALYVNTVTLPWWLLAGRLARTPTVCHVHEAEGADHRIVRTLLTAPLLLATSAVANGEPARRVATSAVPWLARRFTVIENGVAGPQQPVPARHSSGGPTRLVVIGRLSPRKATRVALDAVGVLRARGREVQLEVCGSAFDGYEWYVDELRARAAEADLRGAVTFSGYVTNVWAAFERSDIVLAPSLGESLGNVVIQAQMAGRPVVATAVQGHTETVDDRRTGLLVAPDDPVAMADGISVLLDDPDLAASLASEAQARATDRFSVERYRSRFADHLNDLCGRRRA